MLARGLRERVLDCGSGFGPGRLDADGRPRVAADALNRIEPPYALLATDAPLLAGAWRVMVEHGVPQNAIALGCFDDPFIDFPRDTLFVNVLQPLSDIGRVGVNVTRDRLKAQQGNVESPIRRRVSLAPSVVVHHAGKARTAR